MTIKISDRVKETTATIGTGTLTLAGAYSSAFTTFSSAIGNGYQTFYVIESPAGWETGIGTYSTAGNSLSRDVVLNSSNGGSKVNLVGISTVFCGQSAAKAVFLDGSGNLDLTHINGIVFSDGSLQTVAGGSLSSISGWADSTISARDALISGWAGANDIIMSGWASSNDGSISGWALASDLGISGWAKLADAKILSQGTTLIMSVSGWADTVMSSRDAAVSGWTQSTFNTISNATALSGWASQTITNSGATLSGWTSSTIVNGNNAVSGWANARDQAVSGWIKSTLDSSGLAITNAYTAADSSISGWTSATFVNGDNAVSGWAQSTFNGLVSPTTVSGWASQTIVNSGNALKATIDASGNAVSGWAQSTFNAIVSSTTVSGWADSTITNSGAALSGWAQSTFNGIVSATTVSGWADSTMTTRDNAVSGWASGWAINNDASLSGWAIRTLTNSGVAFIAADAAISGWAYQTLVNSGNAISGWANRIFTGNLSGVWNFSASGGIVASGFAGAAQFAPTLNMGQSTAGLMKVGRIDTTSHYVTMGFDGTTPSVTLGSNGVFSWYNSTTNPLGANGSYASLCAPTGGNVQLGRLDAAAPVAQTLSTQSVVTGTTDTSGVNLTVAAGRGTGKAHGGSLVLQVAPSGATGTTQNTLVNALVVSGDGTAITAGFHFIPSGDKYQNLGAAAQRWNTVYASSIVFSDSTILSTNTVTNYAVSGWANSTFAVAEISGWANSTFAQSGWATSTINNGDNSVSGWIWKTLANSGANLVTADSNVSGWAWSTLVNSGNAQTSSTQTLTNKRVTPRASSVSDGGGSPFINTDNCDIWIASGQKVNISSFSTNLTGTPTNGQLFWIALAGTSGAITITWGASFESSGSVTLPTTTTSTTRLDIGFVWNNMTSKWRCVAYA